MISCSSGQFQGTWRGYSSEDGSIELAISGSTFRLSSSIYGDCSGNCTFSGNIVTLPLQDTYWNGIYKGTVAGNGMVLACGSISISLTKI
jgi:hypothetical protein